MNFVSCIYWLFILRVWKLFYSPVLFFRDGKEVDAGIETDSNLYHELYYHFLGTEQSEDILCWKDPEHPKYTFSGHVTEDGQVTSSS